MKMDSTKTVILTKKNTEKNIFESVCAFPECNTVVAEVVSALKEEEEAPSLMFGVGI